MITRDNRIGSAYGLTPPPPLTTTSLSSARGLTPPFHPLALARPTEGMCLYFSYTFLVSINNLFGV